MIQNWCQHYPKMMPNWSQNDSNMMQKSCNNDPKKMPKWSKNYPRMMWKHWIKQDIRQNRQAHSIKWTGAFAKMDWRIRQNGRMHGTSYMCVYSSGLEAFVAWEPPWGAGSGPTPQKPPAHSNKYTCTVYHACAGPFWRMRQSILANAPVHFIECACLFWRMSYFVRCFYNMLAYFLTFCQKLVFKLSQQNIWF